MKEFKRYIEKERPQHCFYAEEVAAKKAWRAALEWAQTEGVCCGDPHSVFPECEVKEIIDKELEDK